MTNENFKPETASTARRHRRAEEPESEKNDCGKRLIAFYDSLSH